MLNLILGNKCVFCNQRDKGLESIGSYEIYDSQIRYFHRECLQEIVCDPEHFKHAQVDQAIQITEKLEKKKKTAIARKIQFKENCETLSKFCVEDSDKLF